ncbi:PA4780 family RIO1-like protein kinase [Nitrosomonas sp.]|jgi:RIO kinase 1|uniref:PA4780 family RIO1-like protein kinase n=1 Tax=Nitrosomonas sp. TaxID=42353 RepID=UPI000ACB36E8|nr:PA4780 family RIO1-like protein kinase [Nitrosomonas sp.]MDP1785876.1 PA4780 family RIO1-like protein kinase [Nitrosomonas sp.]MDP2225586.1 PA4780 family RIO1-like protein kinase [Nitrosomonas sp.]
MKTPKRLEPLIEEGLIDSVICQLMSGKEAMIYLVSCGDAVRCAKVYKESNKRNFQQRANYTEGRKVKNSRRARAIEKGSRYGRIASEEAWQSTEIDMLCRLGIAGVRVPKFYSFFSGVLLMELITDSEGNVAPRLSDLILTPKQARTYHKTLIDQIVKMLCAGIVHGDLSQYNVLVSNQGPVIIDLPQAVNAADNHQARLMIKRDIDNLTAYFGRFAPELAQSDYATEIWSFYQRGKLPQAQLTGNVKQQDKPVNVGNILQIIDTVIKKEAAWQRHKQTKWGNPLSQC